MKIRNITYLFLVTHFFLISCFLHQTDTPVIWKSKFRDLIIHYSSPWALMPTLDIKEQTLVGVIDNKDGKSYIIQFFDDLPLDKLSNETYYNGIKKTMLQPNPKNKILLEDSIIFHGQNAYRQIFLMYTEKWGMLKQLNYIIRNGKEIITIQISYPSKETDFGQEIIPESFIEFDKMVKINSK